MRLSKAEFEKFKNFLAYEHPVCQICRQAPSVEPHHVKFGRYGADKDDKRSSQYVEPAISGATRTNTRA